MKILGIDPGISIIGWGVIDTHAGSPGAIGYGCIRPAPGALPDRLLVIHEKIGELTRLYKPDIVCVEELFFATNAKTAFAVGQARGVILLSAALHQIPLVSYTPLVIKQAVCGDGKANKRQVEKMVTLTLKLKTAPKPDDVADALAIALTHAFMYKMKRFI